MVGEAKPAANHEVARSGVGASAVDGHVGYLRLCFGEMTPKDARVLAERDPGKYDAMIRSRFTTDYD